VRVLDYSCSSDERHADDDGGDRHHLEQSDGDAARRGRSRRLGYAQLTTGTGTTAVTARIRRGTATSGTLVNEANAETIGPAAGSTAPYFAMITEQRPTSSLQYSLTLSQTGASGNGSALQACILVLAR
jgi:hypothetical protein